MNDKPANVGIRPRTLLITNTTVRQDEEIQ